MRRKAKLTLDQWFKIAQDVRLAAELLWRAASAVWPATSTVKIGDRIAKIVNIHIVKVKSDLENESISQHPEHEDALMNAFYGNEVQRRWVGRSDNVIAYPADIQPCERWKPSVVPLYAEAETDAGDVFRVYLWDKDGGKVSFPAKFSRGLARYLMDEVIPKLSESEVG